MSELRIEDVPSVFHVVNCRGVTEDTFEIPSVAIRDRDRLNDLPHLNHNKPYRVVELAPVRFVEQGGER